MYYTYEIKKIKMISTLKGKVLLKENSYIVLEVGGVGYKIFVGSWAFSLAEGQELFVYTHLSVKERSFELFAFQDLLSLKLFELLLTVNGVGPKAAMSILEKSSPASLKKAVSTEDDSELTTVSGIGKKVAQKIIVELKNKIDKIGDIETSTETNFSLEVFETLRSLGFPTSQIREVLPKLKGSNASEQIKEALKILG